MKPLKLTMTAFGPYKNTEIIDFNELEQNNLFVISGNTGAGKTTVFDGICFALYGSASGTDRENIAMLRSDFAEDDTHTSVELEFEMNGRTFRVLRQLGHVKQGNKSKTGERYELFEMVDGREVPRVDRQIVSEIDKKVEAIIGLTQDQFKQIVMLPQGEFRKLLTSQTENKEAILRRLFKTEKYKQLNELLKNRKNALDLAYNQVIQTRDHYIGSIPSLLPNREESPLFKVLSAEHYNVNQIVAGLEEETSFYLSQIEIDQQKYEDAYNVHDKKQKGFYRAKALNERFQELDLKENQLKELQVQVPLFAKKEKQLDAAERAINIEFYEKQAEASREDEKAKIGILTSVANAKKTADITFEKAQLSYQQEEGKKEQRDNAGKKLDRLQEHLPVVKDIEERKMYLEELSNNGKKTFEALEKVKTALKEKNEAIEKHNEEIKQLDQTVSQLSDKQQKLADMREQAKLLVAYIKLRDQKMLLEKDVQKKKEVSDRLKAAYLDKEKTWLNNQASILADHLHDGKACPVCGSIEHPEKATTEAGMVTKEQLEASKKELDDKDSQYRNSNADLKANRAQLEEKEKEVVQYNIPFDKVTTVKDDLVVEGKQLKEEVDRIMKLRDNLQNLREFQEKETQDRKQLEPRKDQLEIAYQEKRTAYKTALAVYEERLRNIPQEVRVLSELEKKINETKDLKLKLEKMWEDAQSTFQRAKEEQTRAISDETHAQKQLDEIKDKRNKAVKQFHKALENANFDSEDSYHQAKMSVADQQALKEDMKRFDQQLTTLKQQVEEIRGSLKEKTSVDLNALQDQLQSLKDAYELALNKFNQTKENHQEVSRLKVKIMDANEQVASREKQLAKITDLYDVTRGQNSQKISFERYLQIEYLEQIIDAANGRLYRLSNGQFNLIRSDRQESHGRQSGLALDVYDSYTGQTRDVKTLSGGEKFNASLSLALGMSDVIQSFQGNIAINTMFIDEGFGSLDEESLNKSIDTLIDLQQSGRMIGVISHVQDLKAMFPAVLEVLKTKEGYSQTRFVVK